MNWVDVLNDFLFSFFIWLNYIVFSSRSRDWQISLAVFVWAFGLYESLMYIFL